MQSCLNEEQHELVLNNQWLLGYIARKFGKTPNDIDYEDIISIGQIGLCKAAATFNPEKKIKFSTYAHNCVKNEIGCYYFRKRKDFTVSLDSLINCGNDDNNIFLKDTIMDKKSIDFQKKLEDKDTLCEIISIILNKLSLRDAIILLYFFYGTTQKEIAEKINLSQSIISRIVSKCIPKIKIYFNKYRPVEKIFSVTTENQKFIICIFLERYIENEDDILKILLKITNISDKFKLNTVNKNNIVTIYLPIEISSLWLLARVLQEMR